jgi:hypothetical protein
MNVQISAPAIEGANGIRRRSLARMPSERCPLSARRFPTLVGADNGLAGMRGRRRNGGPIWARVGG